MRSLSLQLCTHIPPLRTNQQTLKDKHRTPFKNADHAFQQLLAGPLAALPEDDTTAVLLLDGLHEVPMKEDGTHPLIDLLCQHLLKLPAQVRFIITTRPQQDIKAALTNNLSTDTYHI